MYVVIDTEFNTVVFRSLKNWLNRIDIEFKGFQCLRHTLDSMDVLARFYTNYK